jgi:Lipid A 3-O-deacylase (PagL)
MLFRNPRQSVIGASVFLALLLLAFATKCHAADIAFEAGRTFIRGETESIALSVVFGERKSVGVDLQDFHYECGIFLNSTVGETANNLGAQCLVVDGFKWLELGLGLAYLQNTDQFNGSHLNFALLARLKLTERWAITLDNHVSNAGTVRPNMGRDMMRLRFVLTR